MKARAYLSRSTIETIDGTPTVVDPITDVIDGIPGATRVNYSNRPSTDVILAIVRAPDLSDLDNVEGVDMLPSFDLNESVGVIDSNTWAAATAVISSYGIDIDEASASTVGDILRMIMLAISPTAGHGWYKKYSAEFA